MGMEVEDDVFFADLSKQISLLIMDDDEQDEFQIQNPPPHFQGYEHRRQAMMPPLTYQNHQYEMGFYIPRESKGTGVFIPSSSSYPRRMHKSNNSSERKAVASANTARLHSGHHSKNYGSIKNHT